MACRPGKLMPSTATTLARRVSVRPRAVSAAIWMPRRGRRLHAGERLGQEAGLVGLQCQSIIAAGGEDGAGGVGPAMQGIGGDDRALQCQQRERVESPLHLIAARRELLADDQTATGSPDIDEMEWRDLGGAPVGTADRLAIDCYHPFETLRKARRETAKGRIKGIRIEMAEDGGEGVMAGNAIGQWHD